jgi:hypothetical protein
MDVTRIPFVVAATAFVLMIGPSSARGLRPYKFTDADVVKRGDVQLQIGLLTLTRSPDARSWVAPGFEVVVGPVRRLEFSVETAFRVTEPKFGPVKVRPDRIGTGLKFLLVEGSFQRRTAVPSVLVKAGVVWPLIPDDATELTLRAVVSWNIWKLDLHLNAGLVLEGEPSSDETTPGVASGLITELNLKCGLGFGAELTVNRFTGRDLESTALAGMVYRLKSPNVKFDAAGRVWLTDPRRFWAVTFGVTFTGRGF